MARASPDLEVEKLQTSFPAGPQHPVLALAADATKARPLVVHLPIPGVQHEQSVSSEHGIVRAGVCLFNRERSDTHRV